MSRLDELLPGHQFAERHQIEIAAPPDVVRRTILELDASDLPLTGLLMGLRALPGRLRGKPGMERSGRVLDQMVDLGFVKLVDEEDVVVLGAAGRFWELGSRPVRLADAAAFEAYDEPGTVRAVMDFRLEPAGGGRTRLVTETRIRAVDDAARRSFGRYWTLIRVGSGLIRHELLWAVRRRAERDAAG